MSQTVFEPSEVTTPQRAVRIAVLGYGAIGQQLIEAIAHEVAPQAAICVVRRQAQPLPPVAQTPLTVCTDLHALLAWQPDLVVECAGHAAVSQFVAPLLALGVDAIVASVGALADAPLHDLLLQHAHVSGALLRTVSGAIGGLDALAAAAPAGLDWVRYTGRKPPLAWQGSPAAQGRDLSQLRQAETIYTGSARAAALAYPKNANVAAAVALAGIGFERTEVQLVADPEVQNNVHELEAQGAFGRLHFRIANEALPNNPKSSWLAALSLTQELRRYLELKRRRSPALQLQPQCCS